ncbi:MAG: hypothetical protein MJE12_16395 [Alphaproteobacteria bacterium]|nr:hypothetical protein [Alphaproteobacteria bacterium]
MDDVLTAFARSDVAAALRFSRWGYAAVNTAHVLGIALLVGAIVPFELRLIGFWRSVSRATLVRVLAPVAVTGLLLAVTTGLLLFSIRAPQYASNPFFLTKLILIALGAGVAAALHFVHGFRLESLSRARSVSVGVLSLTCWVGALIAGRLIAFTGD